ncbi:MAG: type II toxin-antitoxin system PemK/MazF family toxin [Rhizobiaceae bacterium]|nr:type II toxin-antitoxin system PemK/MazF family toxin [Rhizobiaceae bacterium]
MSYDRYDVLLVLFPFTEKRGLKQRPAVVLSDRAFNDAHEHAIVAMVTTASQTRWASDLKIANYMEAGLQTPSVVRAKFFTISFDLVPGRVGTLARADQISVDDWVSRLLPVH